MLKYYSSMIPETFIIERSKDLINEFKYNNFCWYQGCVYIVIKNYMSY